MEVVQVQLYYVNSLSTYSALNIGNLQNTSTTILGYVNTTSTYSALNIGNLQTTSTTIFGNLNFKFIIN